MYKRVKEVLQRSPSNRISKNCVAFKHLHIGICMTFALTVVCDKSYRVYMGFNSEMESKHHIRFIEIIQALYGPFKRFI